MSRNLINIGNGLLAKKAPLNEVKNCKDTEDEYIMTTLNNGLNKLSNEVYTAVLRLVKMPTFITIPMLQIVEKTPEILTPVMKKPIWKQVQFVLSKFNSLHTQWCKSDYEFFNSYERCKNKDKACYLTKKHRLESSYDEHLYILFPFNSFSDKNVSIWFLVDKTFEQILLGERLWTAPTYKETVYTGNETIEEIMTEYERTMEKVNKDWEKRKLKKPSREQELHSRFWHLGVKGVQQARFTDRASEFVFNVGCGWASDCRNLTGNERIRTLRQWS